MLPVVSNKPGKVHLSATVSWAATLGGISLAWLDQG